MIRKRCNASCSHGTALCFLSSAVLSAIIQTASAARLPSSLLAILLQVIPTWELLVTSRLGGGREAGPPLDELPDELLPALSKFLFIGKDRTEQGDVNRSIR